MEKRILHSKLKEFKIHMYEEEKSEATIEKYCRDINKFIQYVQAKNEEEDISKANLIEYKNFLKDNYKIASTNSMLVALNKFIEFIGIANLKIKLIKQQKQIFLKNEITKEEYERLIMIANSKKRMRLSMIIQVIGATGIRISELKYITVEGIKSGRVSVYLKGKSRIIFITKALKVKLIHYSKVNKIYKGMIFVTKNGKSVNRSNIWKEMKSLCEDAKIEAAKIFPHNL